MTSVFLVITLSMMGTFAQKIAPCWSAKDLHPVVGVAQNNNSFTTEEHLLYVCTPPPASCSPALSKSIKMALITDHLGLDLFTWMAGRSLCLLVVFFCGVWSWELPLIDWDESPNVSRGGKNGGMTLSKQAESRSFHNVAQPPVAILHKMNKINVHYNHLV